MPYYNNSYRGKRRGKQPDANDPNSYTNPNVTFQQSKTWVAPKVKEEEQNKKLLDRKRIISSAVKSLFPKNIKELEEHRRAWAVLAATIKPTQAPSTDNSTESTEPEQQDPATPSPPKIREPFNGILTEDGETELNQVSSPESFVLCRHTVFTPQHALGPKDVAGWPNKLEQVYEGDDRISTDKLHARFLGAPRVEGNETVNWQHRNIIRQYAFDDFHPVMTEEVVWERNHVIAEVEFGKDWEGEVDNFGDGSGRDVIGWELFDAIDPVDRW